MGALKHPQWELYAQAVARGESKVDAYTGAGYKGALGNASRMSAYPLIVERVKELLEKKQLIDSGTTELALANNQVTKDRIVKELAIIGFTRINEFVALTSAGDPYFDFSKMENEDAWAAVKEIIIEEYTEGRGEDARDVKKTRVTLHDKKGALIDLARMAKMIAPPTNNNTMNIQVNMTEKQMRL